MHRVRYVLESDLHGERGAQLLKYLLQRGANEFTIRVMAMQDTQAPFADAFEDELGPYERSMAPRPIVLTTPTCESFAMVRLWSLTTQSLHNLLSFLDDNIFHVPAGPDGWLEDLTVYRNGELLLGVVSHEREAVLSLTSDEHGAIAKLNISTRAPSQWSGNIAFTP